MKLKDHAIIAAKVGGCALLGGLAAGAVGFVAVRTIPVYIIRRAIGTAVFTFVYKTAEHQFVEHSKTQENEES